MDFSAEKVYRNIRSLAKMQKRGMNELERAVGTYPGYCLGHQQRTANHGYRSGKDGPNLEIIWRFSRELGVTINDLIEKEYGE